MYNHNKAVWNSIKSSLTELDNSIKHNNNTSSAQELWNIFENKIHKIVQSYVPSKLANTKSSSPWFLNAIKKLKVKRDRF